VSRVCTCRATASIAARASPAKAAVVGSLLPTPPVLKKRGGSFSDPWEPLAGQRRKKRVSLPFFVEVAGYVRRGSSMTGEARAAIEGQDPYGDVTQDFPPTGVSPLRVSRRIRRFLPCGVFAVPPVGGWGFRRGCCTPGAFRRFTSLGVVQICRKLACSGCRAGRRHRRLRGPTGLCLLLLCLSASHLRPCKDLAFARAGPRAQGGSLGASWRVYSRTRQARLPWAPPPRGGIGEDPLGAVSEAQILGPFPAPVSGGPGAEAGGPIGPGSPRPGGTGRCTSSMRRKQCPAARGKLRLRLRLEGRRPP